MFQGYSQETVDFMWGIRFNNERGWFLAHKDDYQQHLLAPTRELGQAVYEGLSAALPQEPLILKVSRIYRDARLHHPDPYKESLWICIRRDVDWWAENPCLFFEFRPEGVSYGFSLWHPRVSTMEGFRQRIAAKPDEFLALLRDTERKTGVPVTAQTYKRPKPAPSEALEPFYAWKADIGCIRTEEVGEELFGPRLGARAKTMLEDLIPLYEYFNQFNP